MSRTPKALRTLIVTPFILIVYLNIEKYAIQLGWDGVLTRIIEKTSSQIPVWIQSPVALVFSTFAIGILCGIWIAPAVDKFFINQESIGLLTKQSSYIRSEIDSQLVKDTPYVTHEIETEIKSIIISLKKLGCVSPNYSSSANKLYLIGYYRYLTAITPLLRSGHYREARAEAVRQCEISKHLADKIQ